MKAVYSLTEIIDYLKDIRKDHKNRSQKIIFLSEIFYKEKHELLNKEVHRILYVLVTGFDYFYNINPKDIKYIISI